MKELGYWVYVFVVVWFFHLGVGAASWAASVRIWRESDNKFVYFTMVHLHAAVFDAAGAIVLAFVAQGVIFTLKFGVVLFASALIRDVVRLPLVLYILIGPRRRGDGSMVDEKDKPPQPEHPSPPARRQEDKE